MKAPSRLLQLLVSTIAFGALASAAAAQGLYWIDTNYSLPTINRATVDGVAITSVPLAAGTMPEGLALDANGHVYWTESAWTNAKVNVASAAIAGPFPIVTGGSAFRGIAVDGAASLVYWTTSNQNTGATIRRSALNGTGATTPVTLGSGANPRGIAVDHAGGKIYWADFDQNAIFRANLDGSAVTSLISLSADSGPYGVAVDSPNQRLYWTEYGTGAIKRANTDGTAAITLESGLINPTYIALDLATARMYWSEGGAGSQHVRRASTTGGPILTLPCPLTTYGGLAFNPAASVSAPEPSSLLPTEFALEHPWPNPGSGPIRVRYALPREAHLRLSVFDLQGREVSVLADGTMPAGNHETQWNPRATRGIGAGIYFVRLATDGRVWNQRLAVTH